MFRPIQAAPPVTRQVAERMGLKSVLWVPMIREGAAIGVIGVVRTTAGLFSDEQVRLLQTFADQAVIAIEPRGCSRSWGPVIAT
jgi:GAF domain-containing protein